MGIELLTDEERERIRQAGQAGKIPKEKMEALKRQGFEFTEQGTPLVTTPFFKASLTSPEKRRGLGQAIAEEAPVLGGAVVGGILGGIPGAVFGGTAGEAGKQLGQQADILPGEAPETSTDAIGRMLMSGTQAGVGEGLGRGVQKLMGPFAKTLTKEGAEALQTVRGAKGVTSRSGIKGSSLVIPPAKVTDSRILDIAQNAAEASFIGGNKLLKNQVNIAKFADDVIDDVVEGLSQGRGSEDIGKLVQDAVIDQSAIFRGAAAGKYAEVDEVLGGAPLNFSMVKKAATKQLEELEKGVRNPTTKRLLRDILSKPETMTFRDAHILRSDLLSVGRQGTDVVSDKAQGIAKKIASEIDSVMEQAAKEAGGDALEIWRGANHFWKEGKQLFNNRLIRKIATEDPDTVGKLITTQGPAKPTTVRRIMEATKDNPEVQQAIRGEVLEDMVFKSRDDTGEFIGKKFLGQVKKVGGRDGKALKELFPKGEFETIREWANVKNLVVQGQPDATGRLVVQFGQATAAAGLLSRLAGGTKRIAATILIAPAMLAKMFTSKPIAKFLSEGFAQKTPGKALAKTGGQLLSLMANEGIEFELPEQARSPFSNLVGQPKGGQQETQTQSTPFDTISEALLGQ